MCGLHGILHVGTARSSNTAFISDAFVANSLRGTDSSGILQVDKNGKPYLHKEAIPGATFVNNATTRTFLRDAADSPITICHVRAKTMGAVNKRNAHPFVAVKEDGKRIIGVHNGTLHNWSTREGGKDYDVDSEWLFNRLATKGVEAFKEFTGAFALMWWDEEHKDKVFVARNSQRPLHMLMSRDKRTCMFGSEAGMLKWLAERNKIDTDSTMYELPQGDLVTFDLSKQTEITYTKERFPLPVYTTVYSGPVNYNHNNVDDDDVWGYGNYGGTHYSSNYSAASPRERINGAIRLALEKAAKEGQEEVEEVEAEIVSQANDTSVNVWDDYIIPEAWLTDLIPEMDSEEVKAARAKKVFGQLTWFAGVMQDDNQEVWGDIEDYQPGQGKLTYTGLMRDVSPGYAGQLIDKHKDKAGGDWVVVMGAAHENTTGNYFIVMPLDTKLRQRIFKAA